MDPYTTPMSSTTKLRSFVVRKGLLDRKGYVDRKGLVVSEGIRKNDYRLSRPFVVRKGLMDRRGLVDPAERYWGRTPGIRGFKGFVALKHWWLSRDSRFSWDSL
ncbi:hypothetical protein FA13DRAFT_1739311 [Coprinellus micaceus]|uniref:Uncharacterized protein n=1 Tax=Coprinellus micaceus TaxID=71717 RepID=A0A4Y7SNW1_COPMI|nr:hypothetical protein FA13DRAFT_1739883 [Coprinellus micaceus]TEB24272.1 hypothetical protein FA13DRAFT_1739311 [Coprinellus micaceus]